MEEFVYVIGYNNKCVDQHTTQSKTLAECCGPMCEGMNASS